MTQAIRVIGVDIGGANLKAAGWTESGDVQCVARSFALWRHPESLGSALAELIAPLCTPHDGVPWLAITMTGELADCYATRREGVRRILEQVAQVHSPTRIKVYGIPGRWFTWEEAQQNAWQVAASNWHALANWLTKWAVHFAEWKSAFERAIVVDIGSTTVDILPIVNGHLVSPATSDRERLELQQLVYTGMQRTPICAMLNRFELQGKDVPLMAELFATSDDAYLALGLVSEDPVDCETADGRPRTASFAKARLARMIGEDIETLAEESIRDVAAQVVRYQAELVASAIDRNVEYVLHASTVDRNLSCAPSELAKVDIIATGHGQPLFERACSMLKAPATIHARLMPGNQLSEVASRCAPAVAVAWLLEQTPAIA